MLAFLRILDGLWLLGALFVAFLRDENGPKSAGAGFLWHFCANEMTPPCNGWERRFCFGIAAFVRWPLPWSVRILAFLRGHDGSCDWLGEALLFRHCCVRALASPVGNCDQGIAASCQCPL